MIGETYEITNMDLHFMYRNRPGPVLRRKCRSVVWPRCLADVPGIPFKPYIEQVREGVNAAAVALDTFRDADEINKRFRKLVQQGFMPPRRNGRRPDIDGKRKAAGRSSNDVRDVDRREARQTATARWEACKCEECPDRDDGPGCMGRQRAGMCPAQSGSDMRSDASRDAGAGRTGRDQGGASEG